MKDTYELVEYLIEKSVKKANKSITKIALLSFMAGCFIALGAVGNIIASADLAPYNPGVAKFIGASVFPVGLVGIVILGYDLFTSNCLLFSAVLDKKLSITKYISNLLIVLFFNFLGCLFISYITVKTHSFSDMDIQYLASIVSHKVHADGYSIFLKGILCNVLVCGATLMAYSTKEVISKIFAIWFPIMLFILLGYDHIIANMLYLPTAYALNTGITITEILHNFLYAGLGNFVGGTIFIVLPLYYTAKGE